jgi:hypothetical protein
MSGSGVGPGIGNNPSSPLLDTTGYLGTQSQIGQFLILLQKIYAAISANLVTFAATCGTYQWTNWHPSDIAGTATLPGGTTAGQVAAANYMSFANVSGTLTITFLLPGNYAINMQVLTYLNAAQTAAFTEVILGGTATRYISGPQDPDYFLDAPVGTGIRTDQSLMFLVTATANQTLTLAPKISVTQSGGTTTNYTAAANVTATYSGS